MFRPSLLLLFYLLPNVMFGQTTLSKGFTRTQDGQATAPAAQGSPAPLPTLIALDEAISMALAHSPSLRAMRTEIQQNQAQEVTAHLRPNPDLLFDSQFIPIFQPGSFSSDTLNNVQQFDIGVSYLFERGKKRPNRLKAARDQTAVTASQVADAERSLTFNVAQQFINALLAKSNLQLAEEDLKSFQQTVTISEQRYKAGDISEGDYLKITLQLLQFQIDVSSARVARVQALNSLRQLIGYSALPQNYD